METALRLACKVADRPNVIAFTIGFRGGPSLVSWKRGSRDGVMRTTTISWPRRPPRQEITSRTRKPRS